MTKRRTRWIFLPGMDGTGEFFAPFLRHLPASVEAVPMRYPGNEPLGYDELFSFVRERLPVEEPFLVVAESFSGPLAVRLAASQPPGMIGAVVSASFVRNPLPNCLRRLVGNWLFNRRAPRAAVTAIVTGTGAPDELYDLYYHVMEQAEPSVLAHRAREALSVDECDSLRRCRLPLLFLKGKRDHLIWSHNARLVQRVRPDLPVVPIDASHCLLQMQPEQALAAIRKFAEDHKLPM